MADTFFCLELGERYIKAVDAKKVGNELAISNLGYIETNPIFYVADTEKVFEEQAASIKRLINSMKITKKSVNVIIPDAYTYSQILEMPRLNEKELISAIKYQADQFVPMAIGEASIDVEILFDNENSPKILVLMVASSKRLVEKVQKTIELAGLIPESVENELSATSRFVTEIFKTVNQSKDGFLVANIGLNSSSLYFFEPNLSLITLNHSFNVGYNLFLKEIQVNLGFDKLKAAEALQSFDAQKQTSYPIETIVSPAVKEITAEIKKFINTIAQKYRIEIKNIYLTNEICLLPFLPKSIETNLMLPTSVMNPYQFSQKSAIMEPFKNNLSLFVSTIGGNLR